MQTGKGLLQAQLDESLASEARLQQRLSLAPGGRTVAANDGRLADRVRGRAGGGAARRRARLAAPGHAAVVEAEHEWSALQVLRRTLHEVESEAAAAASDTTHRESLEQAERRTARHAQAKAEGLAGHIRAEERATRRARGAQRASSQRGG